MLVPHSASEVVDASMTALEAAAELAPPDASTLQKAPSQVMGRTGSPNHRISMVFYGVWMILGCNPEMSRAIMPGRTAKQYLD